MVTVMQRGSFCLISASDGTLTSAEVTMTQQAETSSPSLAIFKAVLSIWAGWLYIFESLLIWMWRDTVLIGHIGPNALIICAGLVQARAEHTLGKLTSSQNDQLWENTGTRWKSIADNPLISSPKIIIFVLFLFLETHNLNFWRILLEHFFKPIKVNEKIAKKNHKVMINAVQTVTFVGVILLNFLRSYDEFMWGTAQT